MAIVSDSHNLDYQPLSSLLIKTILSALTILTAFCIRDSVIQGVSLFVPNDLTKKFIFSTLITLFFLFVTVLIAWSFQDKID